MQLSNDRILTTHVGSLPRSEKVFKLVFAKEDGKNLNKIPSSYEKYMENYFREKLKLRSTPLFIDFLESENPYKDKPNLLSDRQKKKRKRLIKRNKK